MLLNPKFRKGLSPRWGKYNPFSYGSYNPPPSFGNLSAWYDASNYSSLVVDSSNRVSLVSDLSGNSAVNALCLDGNAGNYATYSAITAFGTGDFTVAARVKPSTLTVKNGAIVAGQDNSLQFSFRASDQKLYVAKVGVAFGLSSTFSFSALTEYYVTYVRSGTTGTFYVNAVSAGTGTDSVNYSVGLSYVGETGTTPNAADLFPGVIKTVRAYNVALNASQVAADYAGTVQSGCVLNIDFTAQSKLATSFTATTGGTVTINTSGDTGARISGERDLYQGTVSKQPVYLAYSGTKYGYQSGAAGDTYTAANASVTGSQTFSLDLQLLDYTPGSNLTIVDKLSGNNGFQVLLLTTGVVRLRVGDGASVTNVDSTAANTLVDGARGTLGIVWTDGVGASFTQNGSALGTSVAAVKTLTNAATNITIGASTLGKIYGVTVGSVYAFSPSSYTSGSTFVGPLGNTWTLNGGSTIVTRTCLYGDGSDDYMKAAAFSLSQPETVYFVGQQVSWTSGDALYDGNAAASGSLIQTTGSPQLNISAGSSVGAVTTLPLQTGGVMSSVFNGASSANRLNRTTAVTGNAGAANMGGLTLLATGTPGGYANATVSEIALYSAAHATATQDRFAIYAGRKWGIAV